MNRNCDRSKLGKHGQLLNMGFALRYGEGCCRVFIAYVESATIQFKRCGAALDYVEPLFHTHSCLVTSRSDSKSRQNKYGIPVPSDSQAAPKISGALVWVLCVCSTMCRQRCICTCGPLKNSTASVSRSNPWYAFFRFGRAFC